MKCTVVLALAGAALGAEYYEYPSVVSASSTPAKAVVPTTSSAGGDYYDYPVPSSSVKSSTPYSATKPITSSTSSAVPYYDYPVSSSKASSSTVVKPTFSTKWVPTVYPSPCPVESTWISSSKTYTSTFTSTSMITTSSLLTYYPQSSSTPAKPVVPSSSAPYLDYPVSSSAAKSSSTPVAPIKGSSTAPYVYGTGVATPVYGHPAASGTGAPTKATTPAAQFTGAASKNGAGIALVGAALVAALF